MGRRVRLDLTLDQPVTRHLRLLLSDADLRALLSSAGLCPVPKAAVTLNAWVAIALAMERRPAGGLAAATLTAAVEAAWSANTLAGLADAGTTLANGRTKALDAKRYQSS
jgi:hypothetical protein